MRSENKQYLHNVYNFFKDICEQHFGIMQISTNTINNESISQQSTEVPLSMKLTMHIQHTYTIF
jgi:hypothetical protein